MKIPDKIKVGIHTYKIEIVSPRDGEKGYENYAKVNLTNQIIKIENGLTKTKEEDSFLHEILHCCMHEARLNYDLDDEKTQIEEEDVVRRLTVPLLQVLKDNKLDFSK